MLTAIMTAANGWLKEINLAGQPAAPLKRDGRATFAVIDAALASLGVTGAITVKKASRALLVADLAHAADTLAIVYNDGTPAYNGIYAKTGGSGAGGWAITGLALPSTFAADLATVLSQVEGVEAAAAETAADRAAAEVSATFALAARLAAGASASAAQAAMEATGPSFWFDTLAAATAGLSGITANAVVEIFADESQDGHTTRYRKEGGALVFKTDLTKVFYLNQTITLSADTAFGRVEFGPSGKIVTGTYEADIGQVVGAVGLVGIFDDSGGGAIKVDNGQVESQWWGDGENTIVKAHAALPDTGGIIDLPLGRIKKNNFAYATTTADAVYMWKPNVWLRGKGMGRLSADCTTIEGGTIIEGGILNFSSGFRMTDFYCDWGKAVADAEFSGAAGYALANTYPSQEMKDDEEVRYGGYMCNVGGLSKSPTVDPHAVIIAEGIEGVICEGRIEGWGGSVSVVNKAAGTRIKTLRAGWAAGAPFYLKTDVQASATTRDVEIESLDLYRDAPEGFTPYTVSATPPTALMLNPEGGDVTDVRIGTVKLTGAFDQGVFASVPDIPAAGAILGVSIGRVISDGLVNTVELTVPTGKVVEITIDKIEARNGTLAFIDALPTGSTVRVGKIDARNMSSVAAAFQGDGSTFADTSVDEIVATDCDSGAIRVNFADKPAIGRIVKRGSTPRMVATDGFGVYAALANSWTQVSGEELFEGTYGGGRAGLRGRIAPGSSNVPVTIPPFMRPVEDIVLTAVGNNAGTVVMVPVTIKANGNVTVNEVAGGYTNCSTWLSLNGLSWDVAA